MGYRWKKNIDEIRVMLQQLAVESAELFAETQSNERNIVGEPSDMELPGSLVSLNDRVSWMSWFDSQFLSIKRSQNVSPLCPLQKSTSYLAID